MTASSNSTCQTVFIARQLERRHRQLRHYRHKKYKFDAGNYYNQTSKGQTEKVLSVEFCIKNTLGFAMSCQFLSIVGVVLQDAVFFFPVSVHHRHLSCLTTASYTVPYKSYCLSVTEENVCASYNTCYIVSFFLVLFRTRLHNN